MGIWEELEERGLVNQVTEREGLKHQLNNGQLRFYCGFDPTGDSLHIGHLLTIILMRRMQLHGHQPIALVGGGTGMIGDPSGRNAERSLNEPEIVEGFSQKIRTQLEKYLDFDGAYGAEIVNNHDWLGSMTLISFLRDFGKHFSVNYMLAKESVESRIQEGISFTEFSYQIMQSIDFYYLYKNHQCTLQIGGSDQWGNITAGLELIRRLEYEDEEKSPAYGMTIPLVTKADGTKFGKTAGYAIWLDPEKTSPYEMYQFLLNTDDRDVLKFIRYFTFIDQEEMKELEEKMQTEPEKREAHRRLAQEITSFVHGQEALHQAENITKALFGGGELTALTADEIAQGFKDVPSYTMESEEQNLVDLLVQAGIAGSKRQAREDVQNGAVYINGEREQSTDKTVGNNDLIDDQFIIMRRGKKKYFLILKNNG